MKKCPYCAEAIQDAAIVCRYCGRDLQVQAQGTPTVAPKRKTSCGTWGCLAILFVIAIGYCASESDSNSSSGNLSKRESAGERASAISEKRIAGDNYMGCTSRDDMERLASYAAQKDLDAFKQLFAAGLLAGTCIQFERGETVYVMDTAILSGLVKVRRKGDVQEYWTNIEAIR